LLKSKFDSLLLFINVKILMYDDKFNIWDGLDNPERDTDIVDSEFSEWSVRSNEIRKRNY
jgi:hypothetical protein